MQHQLAAANLEVTQQRTLLTCGGNDGKPLASNRKDGTLGLTGTPSSCLITEPTHMGWKDRAIELYKRFGAPVKFSAKIILGAVLPGGSSVVDLIGEVLDCVDKTIEGNLAVDEKRLSKVSAADRKRVEEVLAVLATDLSGLMEKVTNLYGHEEKAKKTIELALATDIHCRTALHRLEELARRFDRLEEQNRKLLEGQGYTASMLKEMLLLVRRLTGVADFLEDLRATGAQIADFRVQFHQFQEAVHAFNAGQFAAAGDVFREITQAQPRSGSAATALATAQVAGREIDAAVQTLDEAVRLRPDDAELVKLNRKWRREATLKVLHR
jgi:tetratricopeptide (TPR) repeat protein